MHEDETHIQEDDEYVYSNAEIDRIAANYAQIIMIDCRIRPFMVLLHESSSNGLMDYAEEELRKIKDDYKEYCMKFEGLPESVRNYPLIAEAKKSLDDNASLLHM